MEVRADRTRIMAGSPAVATAEARGGSGDYRYSFQVFWEGTAVPWPDMFRDFSPEPVFHFTPPMRGVWMVRVTLDDGFTRIVRDSPPIEVTLPVVVTATPTPMWVTATPRRATPAPATDADDQPAARSRPPTITLRPPAPRSPSPPLTLSAAISPA